MPSSCFISQQELRHICCLNMQLLVTIQLGGVVTSSHLLLEDLFDRHHQMLFDWMTALYWRMKLFGGAQVRACKAMPISSK